MVVVEHDTHSDKVLVQRSIKVSVRFGLKLTSTNTTTNREDSLQTTMKVPIRRTKLHRDLGGK